MIVLGSVLRLNKGEHYGASRGVAPRLSLAWSTASALLSELVQAVADPWEKEGANSFQHGFFLLNVRPSSAFPQSAIVISQLASSTNILISCLLVRAAL